MSRDVQGELEALRRQRAHVIPVLLVIGGIIAIIVLATQ